MIDGLSMLYELAGLRIFVVCCTFLGDTNQLIQPLEVGTTVNIWVVAFEQIYEDHLFGEFSIRARGVIPQVNIALAMVLQFPGSFVFSQVVGPVP